MLSLIDLTGQVEIEESKQNCDDDKKNFLKTVEITKFSLYGDHGHYAH